MSAIILRFFCIVLGSDQSGLPYTVRGRGRGKSALEQLPKAAMRGKAPSLPFWEGGHQNYSKLPVASILAVRNPDKIENNTIIRCLYGKNTEKKQIIPHN